MQLTIPKAAKLYEKHRSTIHRHIESGRLSCGFRGDGTRVVEMVELVRCYGEPKHLPPEMQPPATPQEEDMQPAMLQALHAMHQELVALREEVASLRRLPPPSEQNNESPDNTRSSLYDQPKTDDGFLQERPNVVADNRKGSDASDDPHGLRSLARSLYQDDPSD